MNRRILAVIAVIAMLILPSLAAVAAQRGAGGGQRGAPPTPKAAAPFDITGYWTALITEDWEYRMVTPAKGSIEFVPLNNAARTAANAWDPAKDEQAGLQCKGYGAAGIMRLPTRIHLTWENDTTLKLETDYGTQTRLLHFTPQIPPAEKTWQGVSVAQWETGAAGRGGRGGGGALPEGVAAPPPAAKDPAGALKVVTTNMRAGYLRKNGVPYSENAVLTEWFNIIQDQGVQYLAVQTQVDDPAFLTAPFFRTLQFKKEANGSKWNPSPCSAR